ncbi:MAG: calcium/sodium antiporter [Desulfosalsimonadaceae bacterium]
MDLLLPYALLAVGLVMLVKGADLLVRGASGLARRFAVSELAIGLTVVSFGTSAPELFVNLTASFQGAAGIAIGNVLGSNIANILLILGISALIHPLQLSPATVWREIPFSLLAALALAALANDRLIDGWAYSDVSRADGLVFLLFFAIFLYYSAAVSCTNGSSRSSEPVIVGGPATGLASVGCGLIMLGLGGKWIVDGAVHIARSMGMSEAFAGLVIVAVGTSLPELATSAVAAWKRNMEIAVGNVVGSNIFNIFFVLGLSAAIRPIPFHTTGNLDIGMLILASLILFATIFSGKNRRLDRWEGAVLLSIYAAYLACLIWRG